MSDDWYDDLGPPGPVYEMADGVPCPESDRVTAILTDLIAELGKVHRLERRRYRRRCADCGQEWPCPTNVTISYSVARLQEVDGDASV